MYLTYIYFGIYGFAFTTITYFYLEASNWIPKCTLDHWFDNHSGVMGLFRGTGIVGMTLTIE